MVVELETGLHLYNRPNYRAADGSWQRVFREAVLHSGHSLTWEPAALLSTLAFGYVCGDLTPFREIRRQPWLSTLEADNEPRLLEIPPHGTTWAGYPVIARSLSSRLADEAERACQGFDTVYVLLSGGLDSRVTAGTIARLRNEGRLKANPVAVTWGLEDSRDVVYARELARLLGMEWLHVPMDAEVVLRNVDRCAESLAGMILPVHLHKMDWFAAVPAGSLVLATSYGDSVGRAEYSAVHMLELKPHVPFNPDGLFKAAAYEQACWTLQAGIKALRDRAHGAPRYAAREQEMHAFYTRGLLAHAMSSINDYARVYQMFTDPAVYSYVWSFHPSLRFNEIYAELLEQLDPRLARLPWARTNQGMKGPRGGAHRVVKAGLRSSFELYREWISGPLYQRLLERIDLNRIDGLGIFQMDTVRELIRGAQTSPGEQIPYKMAWFATLTHLSCWVEELGAAAWPAQAAGPVTAVQISAQPIPLPVTPVSQNNIKPGLRRRVRMRLERSYWLRKWVRDVRRFWLRRRALQEYPPAHAL